MNKNRQVSVNASPIWKKFAMGATASAFVVAGLASAANVDPIPTISNTFAVAGEVVKSADINKLAESINLLDVRTNNFKDNVTVIDNGNVGIGTDAPSEKLEVVDGNIKITQNGDSALTLKDSNSGDAWHLQSDRVNGYFNLINNGVNRFAVSDDGNVGIGTDAPIDKLSVMGNGYMSGAIGINREPTTGVLPHSNSAGFQITPYEAYAALEVFNTVGANTGIMVFDKNNGNVGIGTTTPDLNFNIHGSGTISSTRYTHGSQLGAWGGLNVGAFVGLSGDRLYISNSATGTSDADIAFQGAGGTHMFIKNDTGDVIFNKLFGTGNAFACLDSTGTLYRSATACN